MSSSFFCFQFQGCSMTQCTLHGLLRPYMYIFQELSRYTWMLVRAMSQKLRSNVAENWWVISTAVRWRGGGMTAGNTIIQIGSHFSFQIFSSVSKRFYHFTNILTFKTVRTFSLTSSVCEQWQGNHANEHSTHQFQLHPRSLTTVCHALLQ